MRIKLIGRRGLHSNFSFHSRIKCALFKNGIDDFSPRSNIWWRGRSYAAASVVSESLKDRKRLSKEARRLLIESFVDKYKAINAGKFPSLSHTHKEVGGSYYVVRNILQELQSKSATSNLKSREIPDAGRKCVEAVSGRKVSSYAEKTLLVDGDKLASLVTVSHSTVPTRRNLLGNDTEETSSTSHKEPDNDGKEVMGSSDFARNESRLLKNERVISNTHLESKSLSEELPCKGSNRKEEQICHSLELDRQKINNRPANDVELQSKSNPWRHIKSIVDGIINIWRNR